MVRQHTGFFICLIFGVWQTGGATVLSAEDPWVGKRAMTRHPEVKLLTFDTATGHYRQIGEVKEAYVKIDGSRGDYLAVRTLGLTGWVAKSDLVAIEDAIRIFTAEIARDKSNVHAFAQRAIAFKERQEFDRALTDYNEAIRLAPKNSSYLNNRGVLWAARQEHAKALADYDEAIRLNPTNQIVFHNRGHVHLARKELDMAIQDFSEAIRLNPKYADLFYDRGSAFLSQKETDKAFADFDEAIRLDPREASPFRGRGHARVARREFSKALADYEEAVRLNPKLAAAHADRAWLLATCPDANVRNGKQAIASARLACELTAWNVPSNLTVLAAANAEAGEFEEAIRWQQKALGFADYAKTNGDSLRIRLKLYEAGKPFHLK